MTGNDDTGRSGAGGALVASDGQGAARCVTRPGADQDLERLPRHQRRLDRPAPTTTRWTGPTRHPSPATSCRPAGSRSTGCRGHRAHAGRRLRRHRPSRAARRAARRSAPASRPPGLRTPGLVALPRLARPGAGQRVGRWRPSGTCRRWCWRPARTRPTAAASSPPRPAVGVGVRAAGPRGLPRGLVARPVPDRDRAARGRRRRRGQPGAGLPVGRTSSGRTGRSRRTPGSTASRSSTTCRWTRWRSRSCSPGSCGAPARPDWDAGEAVGRLPGRQRAEHPAGALGEPRRLLAGDHRRRDRRPGVRRRHRDARTATDGSAATYLATADAWQRTGRVDGRRPPPVRTAPKPYYLRVTKNGDPDAGDRDPGLRRRSADRRAARRRPQLPRPGAARRQAGRRPDDPQHRSRWSTTSWATARRTGGSGTGPASTGTARSATAASGSPPTRARARPSAAAGRCSAGERGEYELRRRDAGLRAAAAATRWRGPPTTRSHLMAEQVWDHNPPGGLRAGSPRASRRCRRCRWPGRTRSSCGWPRNLAAGRNLETPQVVACRYGSEACRR